ncbi:signal peptidase I [Nocardia sp. NPDC004722]
MLETSDSAAAGKRRPWWRRPLVMVPLTVLVLIISLAGAGSVYEIPSQAMEPSLHGCTGCSDDHIYAEQLTYLFSDPEPGDVVIFKAPSWRRGSEPVTDLVKRVIAIGGQTVQCCDPQGSLLIDGKPLDEPYVKFDSPFQPGVSYAANPGRGREFPAVKVPAGRVWVMGDNRAESADSRIHMRDPYFGTIAIGDIEGKAVFKIWPPPRMGTIPH